MRRSIPGGSVHCQLVRLDGAGTGWPLPLTVTGVGDDGTVFEGAGAVLTITSKGVVVYKPAPDEYEPFERVTFTFSGVGLVPQSVTELPKYPVYSPPIWKGGKLISRQEFMELIALQPPPLKSSEFFINGMISGFDPIPLTPSILDGLHIAFPNIF